MLEQLKISPSTSAAVVRDQQSSGQHRAASSPSLTELKPGLAEVKAVKTEDSELARQEEERQRRLEEEGKEEEEAGREHDSEFLTRELQRAQGSLTVEGTITANKYKIQRGHGVMDQNFARR